MSGGPKRNPDKLNTIGVVVVGVCGAVLVYVTIVALQAFYMDDTSEIQTMADYGGNDIAASSVRSTQVDSINKFDSNAAALDPAKQTWRMPINRAMDKIVEDMKGHPETAANLVRGVAPSTTATVRPFFGRPVKLETGSAAPGTGGTGSGSATEPEPEPEPEPGPGSGSAAPATGSGSATGSAQPQKAGSATGSAGSGR
jgi:hypothetical protein